MMIDFWYPLLFISLFIAGMLLGFKTIAVPLNLDNQQLFQLKLMVVYAILLLLIGFLPSSALFFFVYARHQRKGMLYRLAFCLLVPTSLYGIIYFGCGRPLPIGLMFQLLER